MGAIRSVARGGAGVAAIAIAGLVLDVAGAQAAQRPGGQAAQRLRCPPREARVITHDGLVRVYQHSRPATLMDLPVTACIVGRRVGMTLVPAPPPHARRRASAGSIETIVLAGPVVAYVVHRLTGIDTGSSELIVADVATRRILRSAPVGYSVDAGFGGHEALTALVAASDGAVAWISERRSPQPGGLTVSVHSAPPRGAAVVLDEGPAIDTASLELSGGALVWSDAGVSRTAPMP